MNDGRDPQQQAPVPVPLDALSAELLRSVVESFILREGTDYGAAELSLEEKVARLTAELRNGKAQIVFDPNCETVGIIAGKM